MSGSWKYFVCEISQSQNKYYMALFIRVIWSNQNPGDRRQKEVPGARSKKNAELLLNQYRISVLKDEINAAVPQHSKLSFQIHCLQSIVTLVYVLFAPLWSSFLLMSLENSWGLLKFLIFCTHVGGSELTHGFG